MLRLPSTVRCWKERRTELDWSNLSSRLSRPMLSLRRLTLVSTVRGTVGYCSRVLSIIDYILQKRCVWSREKLPLVPPSNDPPREMYPSMYANLSYNSWPLISPNWSLIFPFQEASPDGKFIVLQNTHRAKDEGVGEWKLKRYDKEKEKSHFLKWYSNGMKCDSEKGQKRLKGWLVWRIDLSIIGRSMERRKSYTPSLRTLSSVLENNSRWFLISHSIFDLWSLDLCP